MQNLKQWFFSQPLTSQMLYAGVVVMMVIFLFFEFAFDPWKAHINNLNQRVDNSISTVAWMESQLKENQSIIARSANATPGKSQAEGSLITRIEQSAKKQKMYDRIARITPAKTGRVKVWLNNGNFQQWLVWVEVLKREGVDVVNARVNQSSPKSPIAITTTFSAS